MKVKTFFTQAGVDIVTQPFLVGQPLEAKALQCSTDFFNSLDQDEIKGPIAIVNILRGGRLYFMKDAITQSFKNTPLEKVDVHVVELNAKRYQDSEGDWNVRIWDAVNEDKLRVAKTIFIGDTVATGATLNGVVDWIVDEAAKGKVDGPRDLHVFTIAGADQAQERLASLDEKIEAKLKGTFTLHYANAVFKLEENGTDMSFVGAKCDPTANELFQKKLGGMAPHMKCAVWDWSDRFFEPREHLLEIQAYFKSLHEPAAWILEGISDALDAQGDSKDE